MSNHCRICSICDECNKKSHAYTHCRQAKGIICMEHCDACQYLEIEKGDMHCNYPRQKEKATN